MDATFEAFLRSWRLDPWLVATLVATGIVYFRGWRMLVARGSEQIGRGQLVFFLSGLATLALALLSPLDAFADFLLEIHMVQHLLLMILAPILIWCAAPQLPLTLGLPRPVVEHIVVPLVQWPPLRWLLERLVHPVCALALYALSAWAWHIPALYGLALRSEAWHYVEHVCFLAAGLLFWWPVVQPYPSRPRHPRFVLLPYLFLAGIQGGILSAMLTFADRVLYDHYAAVPRLWDISALDDQAVAGALMWASGSITYLIALILVFQRLLSEESAPARRPVLALAGVADVPNVVRRAMPGHVELAVLRDRPVEPRAKVVRPPRQFDLLNVPLLGKFLRWRHARRVLQIVPLLLAAIIIIDGLVGPAAAPLNLAGVLPWIHWRGFVVLALLVVGNVFCMACPFMLPRTVARRWLPARWNWPAPLRSKWLAVVLLLGFFWAYETFALWASPWWTAWIALAYFVAAALVDGLFRGASFCKYVCPIGQFQFITSLVSPTEVRVRDGSRCTSCTTHDCIRGRDGIPGCETHLFQPQKSSNLDCTFCLDCVHACPHDNVGILAVVPGATLLDHERRSSFGELARRYDVAALVLVFVFAALANAAAMIAPVATACDRWSAALGIANPGWLAGAFVLAVVAIGIGMTLIAASISRAWSGSGEPTLVVAARFALVLVPLAASIWLAHYMFHLLSGVDAFVPATTRMLADWGFIPPPTSLAGCNCPEMAASWLLKLEILSLDLGLLGSLYAGYRLSRGQFASLSAAWRYLAPWAVLMWLMFVVGIWILFEPMQMRGMEMTAAG